MKQLMIFAAAFLTLSIAAPMYSIANVDQTAVTISDEKKDGATEIKAEELPQAVTDAVEKNYEGFTIDKVYKLEDGSYKLKVSMGDSKYKLYYAEDGTLKESKELKDKVKDSESEY